MKWWKIFIGIFSIETLGFIVYNLITGSQPEESVLFNLSPSRLSIIIILALVVFCAIWFIWQSSHNQMVKAIYKKLITSDKFIWAIILVSILFLAIDLYLVWLNPDYLGDYKQFYLNFRPYLFYIFVVSLQSLLFSLTWFVHQFFGKPEEHSSEKYADELVLLLGMFILLVIVKIFLVLPTAYGPIIRGDELRYYEMAAYIFDGTFYIENIYHSPFLYPLMLSISFLFNENAYDCIKILNVIFSSSIIIPLFLIARKYLPSKGAFLITVIASILPFHLLFPRVVMSENLYFPLLLWSMVFILFIPHSTKLQWPWHLLGGITVGLLYMTRYITLALIPCLLLAWWLIHSGKNKSMFQPGWAKFGNFVLFGSGILLGFSPWLGLGLSAGVPLKLILGFSITSETTAAQLTLRNLIIWFSLYLCYLILMAAPVLGIFTSQIGTNLKQWPKKIKNWCILFGALLAGFMIACVRHSWRAVYNADQPSRIMGRYIIYLTPLFILTGFILLRQSAGRQTNSVKRDILTSILLPLALVLFAYVDLLGNLFGLHDGEFVNIIGSVDAAYIQYLGIGFFILLTVLYLQTFYITRKGISPTIEIITWVTIAVFFLAGLPRYCQDIYSLQEFQSIGNHIIEMVESGEYEPEYNVIIYTPEDTSERNRALLLNTFLFNNNEDIDIIKVINYTKNRFSDPTSDEKTQEIRIIRMDKPIDQKSYRSEIVKFGNNRYLIQY